VLIGLGALAGVALVASLPHWLPRVVVSVRMRIFTRINGAGGLLLPGAGVDAEGFRRIYGHPAVRGRSNGAALSDLFWYWLSPGAELHQEHLEAGPLYDEVARATRRILSMAPGDVEGLAARCAAGVLDELPDRAVVPVRLRDLMMPIWAAFHYELVFARPCPAEARSLIVANADDVVTALKCCGLRHMARRDRLTAFLAARVGAGEVPHDLPASLTTEQRALYLQGVFFNTAVVQMSEAMAHLLLVVAQHVEPSGAPSRLADDGYVDRLIDETLRLYPLFGVAHRITTADVPIDARRTIPSGSVVCFDYPAYHRAGYADPDRFDPDRWVGRSRHDAHHIPFGVAGNRPCPAARVAPVALRVVLRETVRRYALHSTVRHTRSLPGRGPCLLVARSRPAAARRPRARLGAMRLLDRWETLRISLVQLVVGTYMVWHARRLRLCQRHFTAAGPS
jgi:hypothetical protein